MPTLLVKTIVVNQKQYVDDMTYTYIRTKIPINQIMTSKELKELQKKYAAEYKVEMNMIGGVTEEIKV